MKNSAILFVLLVALSLPALSLASINFVQDKLWQDEVSMYDKPNGKVLCTVTDPQDQRRRISVTAKGNQGWVPVSASMGYDIVHGYARPGSVVAYTKQGAVLYTAPDMKKRVVTLPVNTIFYFADYDELNMIKGTVSDGQQPWTGWMPESSLSLEPE